MSNNIERYIDKIEELAKTIYINNVWNHPNAIEWDNMTLEDYIKTILDDEAEVRFAGKL